MSPTKWRSPRTALRPPVSMRAFQPSGFSNGLLLGESPSVRKSKTNRIRSASRQSRCGIRKELVHSVVGRKVGLHRAVKQRIAPPRRIGESLVALGRRHLGAALGDGDQLPAERCRSRRHRAGLLGEVERESAPRDVGHQPVRHADRRAGQQQIQWCRELVGTRLVVATTVSCLLGWWFHFAAQQLAGRTGRKAVHEPDPARVLVCGDAALDELASVPPGPADAPAFRTTAAPTSSPSDSCGMPMTTTAATAGCSCNASSTSRG